MPLKKGSSKDVIAQNIAELMRSYKDDGKIGNVKPRNMQHAKKIAAAIAFSQARRQGNRGNSKKRK